MNEFRKQEPVIEEPQPEKAATPRPKLKLITATDFNFYLQKENLGNILPFVFFMTVLAIIYIYNANYAIKTIRECDKLAKEIKEHRAEYISVKSEFMFKSKQSQVSRRLDGELKELVEPPIKITFNKKDEY